MLWLNGTMTRSAKLDAHSAGTLLGWGVFTTIGVWQSRAFALDRHLARLRSDAARLDVPLDWDDAALSQSIAQVIESNIMREGILRLTATRRGDGRWSHEAGSDVSILALPGAAGSDAMRPLRLCLSPFRLESRRPTSGVKATSYADSLMLWRDAQSRGYDEAIACNSTGALCECGRANLFWARGQTLFTPALETGCLPGIGRELMLEWAGRLGLEARQGAFSLAELVAADEAFITSSATGPRPVASFFDGLDDQIFEAPGPVTRRLRESWDEAVRASPLPG